MVQTGDGNSWRVSRRTKQLLAAEEQNRQSQHENDMFTNLYDMPCRCSMLSFLLLVVQWLKSQTKNVVSVEENHLWKLDQEPQVQSNKTRGPTERKLFRKKRQKPATFTNVRVIGAPAPGSPRQAVSLEGPRTGGPRQGYHRPLEVYRGNSYVRQRPAQDNRVKVVVAVAPNTRALPAEGGRPSKPTEGPRLQAVERKRQFVRNGDNSTANIGRRGQGVSGSQLVPDRVRHLVEHGKSPQWKLRVLVRLCPWCCVHPGGGGHHALREVWQRTPWNNAKRVSTALQHGRTWGPPLPLLHGQARKRIAQWKVVGLSPACLRSAGGLLGAGYEDWWKLLASSPQAKAASGCIEEANRQSSTRARDVPQLIPPLRVRTCSVSMLSVLCWWAWLRKKPDEKTLVSVRKPLVEGRSGASVQSTRRKEAPTERKVSQKNAKNRRKKTPPKDEETVDESGECNTVCNTPPEKCQKEVNRGEACQVGVKQPQGTISRVRCGSRGGKTRLKVLWPGHRADGGTSRAAGGHCPNSAEGLPQTCATVPLTPGIAPPKRQPRAAQRTGGRPAAKDITGRSGGYQGHSYVRLPPERGKNNRVNWCGLGTQHAHHMVRAPGAEQS
ncbi:hypothetical protein GWK47_044798 [Chionoecetes opilio]|uniref:Uncharacterized protein n=1 Tax=Chionoecetes opilio TaxID=41210 RepID=A0A8J5CI68_CHIOP|nr:hypothetical protein GWK47_044798 [Chionoecetes opilio]